MARTETRDLLLDTARRVVIRDGAARLTLDTVAREAGISKGGILYHFPTKNALIEAMNAHLIDGWEAAQNHVLAADDEPFGRRLRAYVVTSTHDPSLCPAVDALKTENESPQRVAAALLASAANEPELLSSVRERMQQWQKEFATDGLGELEAEMIRLVADGLWFQEMFHLAPPDGALRARLVAHLIERTKPRDKADTDSQ